MLFHSLQFAVFFAVVFSLYLLLSHRWQNRLLLAASLAFYGAWSWRYLLLFLYTIFVDYLAALAIGRSSRPATARLFLAASIASNVAVLGLFKYYDFLATNVQGFLAGWGVLVTPPLVRVALPIGISFYTFQAMSYTIDVYRRRLPPCRSFADYALYVSFFPQLVAGPIERATRLLPQILGQRTVTLERVRRGAYYFLWGFFLKVFVADNLAVVVDSVFRSAPPYNGIDVLLATYAFSFQVFGDFAGYSSMAIGLATAMGVDLMENFRRPYFSRSVADFWRRWHISLSSWFRDYVFAPYYLHLAARRPLRRLSLTTRHAVAFAATLLVTEYLLGLWHGAAWTYGNFGLYHALMIWSYYLVRKPWDRLPVWIQVLLTYHLVCGGWLIFRASSWDQVLQMTHALLFRFDPGASSATAGLAVRIAGCAAPLLLVEYFQQRHDDPLVFLRWPAPVRYLLVAAIVCLCLIFGDLSERPFIYFQF
jgi:D-alanyl-lipoteichoic acid acyltransferase DltB (MBOAT superfamily)